MARNSPLTPENVLAAAQSIEHELPDLVGDAHWPSLEPQYREKLKQLQSTTGTEQMLASVELVELFAPHSEARERLQFAVAQQDELGSLLLTMAEKSTAVDPDLADALRTAALPDSQTRKAVLKAPDVGKSFKLGNVVFDLGEMHALGVGILTIAAERMVGDDIKPFAVAVGILAIAGKLMQEMTVEFDEREATVLWGFTEIADDKKQATEKAILQATNKIRKGIGLAALDEMAVTNALHKLEVMNTVEEVATKVWQIKEKIRRKDSGK